MDRSWTDVRTSWQYSFSLVTVRSRSRFCSGMERSTSSEDPSIKIQAPGKHQDSNSKHQAPERLPIGCWILELPWSLDLGSWIFSRVLCNWTLKSHPARFPRNGTSTSLI